MRHIHSAALSGLITLLCLLSFSMVTSAVTIYPDLTGVWETTCNGHWGYTNITSQSGASFSGTTLDNPLINGFISGRTVSYTRDIGTIHQDYVGTLTIDAVGNAAMSGTFTQNDTGQWNWTAAKRDPIREVTAPTVSSFTPGNGAAGHTITINGTNLQWVFRVSFNGTVSSSVSINSDTSITAIVPTGATTGKIAVTSAGGTGTSADDFAVYEAAQLEVMLDLGAEYIGDPGQVQLNYTLVGPQTYNGVLPIFGGIGLLVDLEPGTYTLTLSGSHWLTRVVKDIVVEGVKLVNVSLVNGDSDGDNQVNLFDFVVLDINFGKAHAMADLDGSGTVNLFDYVIIDTNFGAQADISP